MHTELYKNDFIHVTAGDTTRLFSIQMQQGNITYNLSAPVYGMDNKLVGDKGISFIGVQSERKLNSGGMEFQLRFSFIDYSNVYLMVYLRCYPQSPFIRYRYELKSDDQVVLTKKEGKDFIVYTGFDCAQERAQITEIQFSQFESIVHSFLPSFEKRDEEELLEGTEFPGPIALFENKDHCGLLAYEHGAEYPDSFLSFHACHESGNTRVNIRARKGNYYQGQIIDEQHSLKSPWFHFALVEGNEREKLLMAYRAFFLNYISENTESRKPYVFYNTWNFQERNRYFKGMKYLDSMHQEQIMREIDIAHEMGVDVFVIDTGWYNKTGDWVVNDKRFPDRLKSVKAKLDSYGMKLGLWFNPIVAARTSEIYENHPEYVMTWEGKENYWGPIWETEESYGMCLVSPYADFFIKKLVQLNQELGVTYFKWDAIGQYGCDAPHHHHGNENTSVQERRDCYAYQMGLEMIRIVEEVTQQCPDAIVDFDITEGGRFVGLGFLSVGKYFLMNNGPYFSSFDIPKTVKMDPDTINVFFYPGTARAKVCRQGTRFDVFVPSILFLTHFLPDPPRNSQITSLASLFLGGNGIWGDLLSLSNEDIELFGTAIGKYKKVADSVVKSYPRVKGFIGSSPEIHEKINYEKSEGLVCFFTRSGGTFTHVTQPMDQRLFSQVDGADRYEVTPDGRLKIVVNLKRDESRVVFVFSSGH